MNLLACSRGTTREVLGHVLDVSGDVSQLHNDGTKSSVRSGAIFAHGDVIVCGAGSAADLELLPSIRLHMSAGSELRVDELRLSKDGNETQGGMLGRRARVTLVRGQIVAQCDDTDEPESDLTVETANARVQAAHDSAFEVNASANETNVACARNVISIVQAGRAAQKLIAGSAAHCSRDNVQVVNAGHERLDKTAAVATTLAELPPPETAPFAE